jgi:hypothetical protein
MRKFFHIYSWDAAGLHFSLILWFFTWIFPNVGKRKLLQLFHWPAVNYSWYCCCYQRKIKCRCGVMEFENPRRLSHRCHRHRRLIYRWCHWLRYTAYRRCHWHKISANFCKNLLLPQWDTQGPGGNWFMRKPELKNLVSDSLSEIHALFAHFHGFCF